MKEFWNERFAQKNFVYGTEPNAFFRQEIDRLSPGHLLLPAEGEGRNAVYAAQKGWQVYAFDYAETAREKALQLAARRGVQLQYELASYDEIQLPEAHFDALALIYAHTENWQHIYPRLFRALRPGGTLIVELFAPAQLGRPSGGPKQASLLVSAEALQALLQDFSESRVWEEETFLNEGAYHHGEAAVTRAVAKR
ncbi:class I SAM-dependent methyltransferase [Thermonema rossianum]|uniref:class I SAM-dependent methyltransferase n=1 Tax=Thermonema rossianum TaxID=55505 RepID=UPI00056F2F79|nr:class I SAM-dependent methyltransferase [Thermonema rossianum]